ncbi:MAG: FtsW/RodA/SpoVE family cell cycle protein [Planctomycetota bacterium]
MSADLVSAVIKGTGDPRVRLFSSLRFMNPGLSCVLAGVALSLLGVYAIDVAETRRAIADATSLNGTAMRQAVFCCIGLGAALVVALPHYRFYRYLAWIAFLLCLGLLVFLLVPAVPAWLVTPRNGARGWINLGVADFQPAEVTKIAYVLVVAAYLRYRREHRSFLGLVMPGLLTLPPVALITLQPDLGTASLFIPSLFAMLVAAGARLRHLSIIVLCAALAAPATYPLLKDHQKRRFVALVKQVQGDRSSADDLNFQSFTAQTMVGSGQVGGTGDAHARALLHYNRLPERHNDMVFAVITARFGFVGGAVTLLLYGVWTAGALATAAVCREPFGRLICIGLTGFVVAQVVVNVGMTVGLLPIIGVTLPFVSYGGSSMLTVWLMTGLIYNVGVHRPRPPFRDSFEWSGDAA